MRTRLCLPHLISRVGGIEGQMNLLILQINNAKYHCCHFFLWAWSLNQSMWSYSDCLDLLLKTIAYMYSKYDLI